MKKKNYYHPLNTCLLFALLLEAHSVSEPNLQNHTQNRMKKLTWRIIEHRQIPKLYDHDSEAVCLVCNDPDFVKLWHAPRRLLYNCSAMRYGMPYNPGFTYARVIASGNKPNRPQCDGGGSNP